MSVAGAIEPIRPHSQTIFNRGTLPQKEKASLACKEGAMLISNSGYADEAGTAPSVIAYVAAQAGHNSSTDGTDTFVWPVTAGDLWRGTYKTAVAQGEIRKVVGLVKDGTTGFWYLDAADTNDQVVVEQFVTTPQLGATGDTYVPVLFRFQIANIESS